MNRLEILTDEFDRRFLITELPRGQFLIETSHIHDPDRKHGWVILLASEMDRLIKWRLEQKEEGTNDDGDRRTDPARIRFEGALQKMRERRATLPIRHLQAVPSGEIPAAAGDDRLLPGA